MDPRKIEVTQSWPTPKYITDLRAFLGLGRFFKRFIKNFSSIAKPLTDQTKKHHGIKSRDKTSDDAFEKLNNALTTAPIFIEPYWNRGFRLHWKASVFATGGTLTHWDD